MAYDKRNPMPAKRSSRAPISERKIELMPKKSGSVSKKELMPKRTASPKPRTQLKVVLPNGNRVGIKDLGTNKGTPKAKPMPKDKSNKQYLADQKKYATSKENKK